jgi:Na+/H+ antiporter NhaD/arsenite permease-like protein
VTPALLALLALIVVLALGAVRPELNVGVLATAVAFGLGMGLLGLGVAEVSDFLPAQLLLTVVGITLLFELARSNGTLDQVTRAVLRLARGNSRVLPLVFFLLTFALSALGPGNIAATTLLAPVAMGIAVRAGINPTLMAILVCTGANAGTFSPAAVTGGINAALLQRIGLEEPGLPVRIFLAVAAIQSVTALLAYALFGGYRAGRSVEGVSVGRAALDPAQRLTLGAVGLFVLGVMVFNVPPVAGAFVLAALLALFKLGDLEQSLHRLPWSVVMLIGGISILMGLLERLGSLELLTSLLARYSSPEAVNALLALLSGLASVGSSSSGVVMPLMVPLAPELLEKLGGGDLVRAVIAIDIGSHMVDVSPLSTLGALCMASLPEEADRSRLFRQMLLWGFSMAFVGALLAFVFLDLPR